MAFWDYLGGTVILSAAKDLVGTRGVAKWLRRFFATLREHGWTSRSRKIVGYPKGLVCHNPLETISKAPVATGGDTITGRTPVG